MILESDRSCTCIYYSVFYFWPFMLLEWGGTPLNNPPTDKWFSMIWIAVQHFQWARSFVLFHSQKLQAYWDWNTYLPKFTVLQYRCSTITLLRWLGNYREQYSALNNLRWYFAKIMMNSKSSLKTWLLCVNFEKFNSIYLLRDQSQLFVWSAVIGHELIL